MRLLGVWLVVTLVAGCGAPAQHVQTPAEGHFFRPTSKAVISSPIAHDWDGDGLLEIAIGSWDGYFYLLDRQLNDRPGWPRSSRGGFFPSPALADLDGDGAPEIVAGSEAGRLFAWHADGRDATGYPLDLGYQIWASVAVLNGPRLALGDRGAMHLLDAQGRDVPGWPQPVKGWPVATAAYAPGGSGGGLLALTTLTPGDPSQGWLYAWHEEGTLLPGFPLELSMDSDSSPALAQFDGDGRWWIVFGDDAGWLHVVDAEGRARPGFPVRSAGSRPGPTPTPHPPGGNIHSIEASPAIADLDGDGRLEIVVGAWDGRMYLWDDAGRLLPGWPIMVADQIISSASLVDLDADGRLDVVVGSKDGKLYGWTPAGRPLPGFPYDLGSPVFSSPWVGDLEGDGLADIVVGANNGIHLLASIGPLGHAAWPTFHGDAGRRGVVRHAK